MAGFDLHEAAGDCEKEVGRETEVPVGCARDPGGDLRGQDIQKGYQYRADAVSAGCRESFKGKLSI